jgi:hypothetical protein
MVQCASWLENNLGVSVLSIDRQGFDPANSCTLEVCGRHRFYVVRLDGGFVFLSAQLMDAGGPPEILLTAADGEAGWKTVSRLIAGLERNEVQSLQKPIEFGEGSNGSFNEDQHYCGGESVKPNCGCDKPSDQPPAIADAT